jgi:hypothetical protein
MRTVLIVLVVVGLVATLGILLVGVFGMAQGGAFNRKYGNLLMRARVVSQFAVVVLIALLFILAGD